MLKTIHLIKEQNNPQYQNQLNSSDPAANQSNGEEQSQDFNIDGEHITLFTRKGKALELTPEMRSSFQTTADDFKQQITDLLELNSLEIHDNEIKWSGKLTKFDLEFVYLLGEKNGVYIKGNMIKIDEEFTTMLGQLTQYYQVFTQKWSPIINQKQQGQQQPQEGT